MSEDGAQPGTKRNERLPATAEMIGDYERMGLRYMAAKYHISAPVLRDRLELAGIPIRQPSRPARDHDPFPKPKERRKPEPKRKPGPRNPSPDKDPHRQNPPAGTALTAAIVAKFEADVPLAQIAEWAGLSEKAVTARLQREGYEPS